MMDKKGAIEFSMTTIMVIIIGVAVLALGLTWIRGTFSSVNILTEEALAGAETIVSELGATGKIGVPASLILEPGQVKKFQVIVRNDLGFDTNFKLGNPTFIGSSQFCLNVQPVSTSALTIPSGESEKFIIAVDAIGGGCTDGLSRVIKVPVVHSTSNDLYGEEAVTITINR